MANNRQQMPFWDFVQSLNAAGAGHTGQGVDQPYEQRSAPGAFPEGFVGSFGGPWGGYFSGPPQPPHGPHGHHHGPPHGFEHRCRGGCGPRGRHCRRPEDPERSGDDNEKTPEGDNEKSGDGPRESGDERPHEGHGHHGGRGGWGEGRRGGWSRRGHGRGGFGGPSFGGPEGNFDLSGLMNAFAAHPIGQALRNFAEQAQNGAQNDISGDDAFTPPIDIFSNASSYVLHIALPGAKKEDVGINWDADKSELNIAGVVYRPGDEEFLNTLAKGERKVGVFERNVKLPLAGEEKEEVDGDNISAKLEDGVLVVTVPKVEKDWTEVKKVDIE